MLTEFALPEISVEQQNYLFHRHIGEYLQPSVEFGNQHSVKLVNTRLWLFGLEQKYGKHISIDEVPEEEWDALAGQYDTIWFMGIYKGSSFSRNHAKKYEYQYRYALPDLDPEHDVVASPFAIPEYIPNPSIASDWNHWDKAVSHLHERGKKVMIDFVPNHTAVDSTLVFEHPEYFIQGLKEQYEQNPNMYIPIVAKDGNTYYVAHGRYSGSDEWADTLQLNYARSDVQQEMERQLLELVDHADGVRCDMTMLVNASTFLRTWGYLLSEEEKTYILTHNFWETVVAKAKKKAKEQGREFTFLGEVYWEEDQLQSFDYLYAHDAFKVLNDTVHHGWTQNLREYIGKALQNTGVYSECVYTENHDEERAASAMGIEASKAAFATIAFLPNTLLLVNQGQEDGWKIRPPMQIRRFPDEPSDSKLARFYSDVLFFKKSKLFSEGQWCIADIHTYSQNLLALHVRSPYGRMSGVICVNLGKETADCSVPDIGHDRHAAIYNLNKGSWIPPDEQRIDGIFLRLFPFESQIVLYEPEFSDEVRLKWN